MEVKITSMQGMHIFQRDRTTQLIKCTPWSMRLCPPHPTLVKKMRTFLEVEGKIGLIPQPTSSQYRPTQLDTNPNVRKDKATEKRKRAVPTKRFRPSTVSRPSEAATCPPMTISKTSTNDRPQVQEETSDSRPPTLENVPVHESTPWPDAGKISGNLFEERKDWLLLPNYLNNDNEDTTGVTSPKPPIKEEPKTEEQSFTSPKQTNADGDQIVPSAKIRKRKKKIGMAIARNNCNRKHCLSKRFR